MNPYKALLAPFLIGFGVIVNLTLGPPLGPILFSFGLLGVCTLGAELFTGKAGYMWRNESKDLARILLINLVWGYVFGMFARLAYPALVPIAAAKIAGWTFSLSFFIQAVFCGMIMYIAVDIWKRGYGFAGIFLGVPLFIFCGFQHCIANVIIFGIAGDYNYTLLLAIVGNLIGSIIINILTEQN